jgi:hypothetical protein
MATKGQTTMTINQLIQAANEGDGAFAVSAVRPNQIVFNHVDGRAWTTGFATPSEARGWMKLALS